MEEIDPNRAEELHRQAVDADPAHAHIFVNYAQLLFAQHRNEEAIEYVNQALAQPDALAAIRLEVAFYLYAHVPDLRQEALWQLVSLLPAGERSNGCNFSPNLERAKQEGDERLPFLTALADVISGPQPLEDLDRFDEWQNASP